MLNEVKDITEDDIDTSLRILDFHFTTQELKNLWKSHYRT